MRIYYNDIEITEAFNINLDPKMNGIPMLSFQVPNTHLLTVKTIRDGWVDKKDNDDYDITVLSDTDGDLMFVGYITAVDGEVPLTIHCESSLGKLTWYNVSNATFWKEKGSVTTAVGTSITMEDANGDAHSFTNDQHNGRYIVVSDGTRGEEEDSLNFTLQKHDMSGSIALDFKEIVTGSISGATGRVMHRDDDEVYIVVTSGTFQTGEVYAGTSTRTIDAISGLGTSAVWDSYQSMGTHDDTEGLISNTADTEYHKMYMEGGIHDGIRAQIGLGIEKLLIPKTATISKIVVSMTAIVVTKIIAFSPLKDDDFSIYLTFNDDSGKSTSFKRIVGNYQDTVSLQYTPFELIDYEIEVSDYWRYFNQGATYYEDGWLGVRIYGNSSADETHDDYQIWWDAIEVKVYYDTDTFDTINVPITDTVAPNTITSGTNFATAGVSPGDSVMIGSVMEEAFDAIGATNENMPNIPTINILSTITKGITAEYGLNTSGYKLFTKLCELNAFEYAMVGGVLKCGLLADFDTDGGTLTGFNPPTNIESPNNDYGTIAVVYGTLDSSYPNPAIVDTGNGNPKTITFVKKDILTYAEAMNTANDLSAKYTNVRNSVRLEWNEYKNIIPGHRYAFSAFGENYTNHICRRVNYSYTGGGWKITGYFGGGETPAEESIGMQIGRLEKSIGDIQGLEFTSTYSPANTWSQIGGKPSTFPPSGHNASHESGGSDEINHDTLDGFVAAEHKLEADINHDALTNFEATEHIAEASLALDADQISIDQLGSPTYTTLDEYINNTISAGIISGGSITDSGSGQIDVSAGTGLIKTTNSGIGVTQSFNWSASTNITIDNDVTSYVYINYNAGTPIVGSGTSNLANGRTIFNLGKVFREDSNLHILNAGQNITEPLKRIQSRTNALDGTIVRASGMLIAEEGERYLSMTSGQLWHGFTPNAISAVDTSGADEFELYSYVAGAWVESDASQLNNTQYNDVSGAGALATLSNNRFGVHWVYSDIDGHLLVVYGQGNYLKLSDAEDANPPNVSYGYIADMSILIGKVIFEKSATNLTAVHTAFGANLIPSVVTDHTDLATIGTNTHAEIDTHIEDATIHFTEDSISHDAIADVSDSDHHNPITLTSDFATLSTQALTINEDDIDHTQISNIGTYTHETIDDHLTSMANPHVVNATQISTTESEFHYSANDKLQDVLDDIDQETYDHIESTAAHGATGAVVGTTNTQTLTNKTLTSPTINGATLNDIAVANLATGVKISSDDAYVEIDDYLRSKDSSTDVVDYVMNESQKNEPQGIAGLSALGFIDDDVLPMAVLGGMVLQGAWDASSGSFPSSPDIGDYWTVGTAGTTGGITYALGDMIAYSKGGWLRLRDVDGNFLGYKVDTYALKANNAQIRRLQIAPTMPWDTPNIILFGYEVDEDYSDANSMVFNGNGTTNIIDESNFKQVIEMDDTDMYIVQKNNDITTVGYTDFWIKVSGYSGASRNYVYPTFTESASAYQVRIILREYNNEWVVIILYTDPDQAPTSGTISTTTVGGTATDHTHFSFVCDITGATATVDVWMDNVKVIDAADTGISTASLNEFTGTNCKTTFLGDSTYDLFLTAPASNLQNASYVRGSNWVADVTRPTITDIQTSDDAFSDVDTELMTAASIVDKITTDIAAHLSAADHEANTDTQLTDEQVQDKVGAMFTGNTETRCTVTYQDADGTIDIVVDDLNTDTQLSTEQVQDIVGGMLTGTETRIGVSYDDSNGKINFVVDDMTANDNTWRGIDNTPVNGQTSESISSNWAYDHNANASAHHTASTLSSMGVTATSTELNKLDGFTGDATDLNYAKSLYDTGVTAAEFNTVCDGSTAKNSHTHSYASLTSPTFTGDVAIAAAAGAGYRFWNSSSYQIYMANYGHSGAGRVDYETTSDYNMYFRMTGGTSRGFCFQNGTSKPTFGIHPSGVFCDEIFYMGSGKSIYYESDASSNIGSSSKSANSIYCQRLYYDAGHYSYDMIDDLEELRKVERDVVKSTIIAGKKVERLTLKTSTLPWIKARLLDVDKNETALTSEELESESKFTFAGEAESYLLCTSQKMLERQDWLMEKNDLLLAENANLKKRLETIEKSLGL